MNTRKFPRTLNEAFPRGADYASAIERPRAPDVPVMAVCICIIVGLLALIGIGVV